MHIRSKVDLLFPHMDPYHLSPAEGNIYMRMAVRILLPMGTSPGNVPVKTTEVAHNHHNVGFGTAHPLIMNDIRQIVVICAASVSVSPAQWFVLICSMFYAPPSLIHLYCNV